MSTWKGFPVLAALLLAPAGAAAQPVVYVCTPSAQVVAVNTATVPPTTGVVYSGSGSFADCVLGPDLRLYVANGNEVLRFDPTNATTANATDEVVATLSSTVRGLSFNVTTLYVSTAGSGLWAFPGISEPTATVPTSGSQAITGLGAGQGTTFSIDGRLWFVSAATVRQSLTPYTTSAALVSSGLNTPVGVGTNTCGNLLVADSALKTIRRYTSAGFQNNYLDFEQINALKKHFPRHLEIDASNRTYVVADSTVSGKNALIVRAGPDLIGLEPTSSCVSTNQVEILAELAPNAIPGLLSNRAVGIAVGPTHHQITKTFAAGLGCTNKFNFGYHTVNVTFTECLNPLGFGLTVSALKSPPSQVSFANDPSQFPTTPIEGMRYSPLGGFIIQYVYLPVPPATSLPVLGTDFADVEPARHIRYGFFTQEAVATPGIARTTNDDPAAHYTHSIAHDYWDVGALDPEGGETIPDWSKRVVFNSGLAAQCSFGGFQEPLNTGNPQFNNPQNIKIAFQLSGTNCSGGVLHVSVVKVEGTDFTVMPVTSGQQDDNLMDTSGPGNYHYNLETENYSPGTYWITIWGNMIAPITKTNVQINN
jgi:hypothetical protein